MQNKQLMRLICTQLFLVVTLAVFLVVGSPAWAQVTTSSIVGTVTDQTGAAVQSANIAVRDVERNLTKTVTSNESGGYRVDFLLAGNYSVSVSAPGFKSYVQGGIALNVGVPVTINVQLQPGAVTESIQVTTSAPLVETSNAEIGTTVSNKEMTELPLVNRNAFALLDLTPGVQSNTNTQSFGAPTQTTIINGGSNNGAGTTNYYFDGAPNLNALNGGGGILPNPDALQEFRVQTSDYGAAFGRFPSGIVNAVVRSGTNAVHGAVFEFLRNPHFNARPWGSLASAPLEPLHRNQFGATVGGPVIKDKTFFFGSYAGLRQTDATLYTGAVVPSALERTGDFSQSIGTRPKDPLTGTNFVCNGAVDVICGSRLDPVALNLLKYVPAANTTITTSGGSAPAWSGYASAPINQDDFLIKVNHSLPPAHTLYATYFMSVGNTSSLAASNPAAVIGTYARMQQTWRQQNGIVSDTWMIGPNLVNNVWASYTRMRNNRTDTPSVSLADLGSTYAMQGPPSLPNVSVTGFWNMRNANAGPAATDDYSIRDLVTWSRGKHTLQFGGEFLLDKAAKAAYLNNYGQITFSGVMTKNALGDYMLGIPATFEQDSPALTRTSAFTYAGFFQDDYRLSSRLTLNLGIRYDIQTPPVESADHNVTFIAGEQSTRYPNAPLGVVFPGDAGVPRGITNVRFEHFSPRVGFAFDPWGNAKTAVRGGVGLFWGSVSEEFWAQGGNTSPFALAYTFPTAASLTGSTLSNPYRGGTNPFPNNGSVFTYGGRLGGINKDAEWPRTIQTNLSIQQQLTNDLGVTIAYVGAFSSNLGLGIDRNNPSLNTNYAAAMNIAQCGPNATIVPTTSNSQCRRPIQPAGSFSLVDTVFNASYNGLQISVTKRLSHQISASGYYSWSKTMGDVALQGATPAGSVQDVNNLKAERSRAANDLTNQAVISLIWQPEVTFNNRMVKSIVNGWEVVPLTRLHTGAPFTIANGIEANLDGGSGERAQLTGLSLAGPKTVAKWFNTAAFAQLPAVTGTPVDGNSSNNMINSPSFHSVDLALVRVFPIFERIKLQFRADVTNAFNVVSHTAPGATVNTATFGVITGANTVRQVQLGAKVNF